ncbi:MAG: alpha/beta hydrolase [Cyanobacteria bacterium REEB67]|nr:alpha/beta hydrolase [Cyanobacteria bacterium REEB67]
MKSKIMTAVVGLSFGAMIMSQAALAQGFQSLSPEEKRAKLGQFLRARNARGPAPVVNADNYTLRADVAYGPAPLEKLDVYTPKSSQGAAPILMFVHGGGWSKGDKRSADHAEKASNYTANGIVFVGVNYGLAPQVVHPKQVEDIADALLWVKKHATEIGGDPNRIYLMGHSAGAQLVDLLGTNDRFLKSLGLSLDDIKGVISLDTASLDLGRRVGDESFETGLVGPMITAAFGSDPKQLADGSPTLNIHAGTHYPPFLMYCGSKRTNCVEQHQTFAETMKRAGGQVIVRQVPLSHRDINRQSGQADSEIFQAALKMVKGEQP